MTELIIFTNNESLENINSKFQFGWNEDNDVNNVELTTLSKFNVLFINDKLAFEDQVKKITIAGFKCDKSTYIHLHESSQAKMIDKWVSQYPNAEIEKNSHYEKDSNFYHFIIPKIKDKTLSREHLEIFFQTELEIALNELCATWATIDFSDKDAMETLAKDKSKKLNPLV